MVVVYGGIWVVYNCGLLIHQFRNGFPICRIDIYIYSFRIDISTDAALFCGEHKQAFTLLMNHCVPSYKKYLGDHPWVASILSVISKNYEEQGKIDEAVYYAKMGLGIREELLENHQDDTAKSYFNLGQLFQKQNNYMEALGAFNKALFIRKKLLGEHHGITMTTNNALKETRSKLLNK
jgi:tetratricopeptide (TPR) repeat protein